MLAFGERHLRNLFPAYADYYNLTPIILQGRTSADRAYWHRMPA